MKEILIKIRNKIADRISGEYVCGNSDFVAVFDFDEEWSAYETKTARFYYGDDYIDKPFNGDRCEIPILSDIHSFEIGVFAGNLKTSTSAYVPARKSILCKGGSPAAPSDDVYAEIMEMLNELNDAKLPPEEIAAAVKQYLDENGIGLGNDYTDVNDDYLKSGISDPIEFLLTLGVGKFSFTGNCYKYYYDGVYNEFGKFMYRTIKGYGDDEIVDEFIYIGNKKVYEKTSNINGTAICGITEMGIGNAAVSKKYVDDAVAEVEKKIPTKTSQLENDAGFLTEKDFTAEDIGCDITVDDEQCENVDEALNALANREVGSSDKWEFIGEFNVGDEDVAEWIISEDAEGKPIELKQISIELTAQPATVNAGNDTLLFGNPAVKRPFNTWCYYATRKCLNTAKASAAVNAFLVLMSESSAILSVTAPSLLNVAWQIGDNAAGGGIIKNCIGGVAMKAERPGVSAIGAGSTIKIWGVRI